MLQLQIKQGKDKHLGKDQNTIEFSMQNTPESAPLFDVSNAFTSDPFLLHVNKCLSQLNFEIINLAVEKIVIFFLAVIACAAEIFSHTPRSGDFDH